MKIDQNFPYDIFRFLHRPIQIADKDNDAFLERYMKGMQTVWELLDQKIKDVQYINNPEKCRVDLLYYVKDIVGLTRDLSNITDNLEEDDLRKIILLAVPLWKKKGLELGFKDIVKLFVGFDSRVFNWFDYRMIIGEKAIGEEQLGEDAWIISRPGVQAQETVGDVLLLLQFNEYDLIKDGSEFQNNIISHGDKSWQLNGPFGTSLFNLRTTDFHFHIPHRDIYDYTKNFSKELYIKTNIAQIIPLFHKWDSSLNKGVKLIFNSITNEISCYIADGTTTQTHTVATGLDLDNGNWYHVAWVVDFDKDKLAVWVNGSRKIYEELSGALILQGINNDSDLFIGDIEQCGEGVTCSWDGIRISNDARYDVELATITQPAVNFIEYQEEQLDEFQIDIRVVDNGTLDRVLLKRILNLMRGSSERLNILYIDFYDVFDTGKGQYKTVFGSAYTELTDSIYYLKLPENSLEVVDIQGSDDWENYIAQHRCLIYSGDKVEIRFCIQDELNFYAFRVDSNLKLAYFEKCIAGVRTSLATPKYVDVEASNLPIYLPYYVFMVSCFKNVNTGITTLRANIDSNLIFNVNDNNFGKGTFGLYTPSGSTVWCSEVEMFQMPLAYDRINPNSEF